MELQIIGQNIEVLPTVRSYVERKFAKLTRHFPTASGIKIELSEQKTKAPDQHYRAQITMDVNGTLLRAEERAENLLVAIDRVVPIIDRQIERFKGKVYKKAKAGLTARVKSRERSANAVPPVSPNVVRTKRFPIRLMTAEDAVEQMELLGHDFFLFRNASSKELNLLYKRKDGNYSIIEPETE